MGNLFWVCSVAEEAEAPRPTFFHYWLCRHILKKAKKVSSVWAMQSHLLICYLLWSMAPTTTHQCSRHNVGHMWQLTIDLTACSADTFSIPTSHSFNLKGKALQKVIQLFVMRQFLKNLLLAVWSCDHVIIRCDTSGVKSNVAHKNISRWFHLVVIFLCFFWQFASQNKYRATAK